MTNVSTDVFTYVSTSVFSLSLRLRLRLGALEVAGGGVTIGAAHRELLGFLRQGVVTALLRPPEVPVTGTSNVRCDNPGQPSQPKKGAKY